MEPFQEDLIKSVREMKTGRTAPATRTLQD